MFDAAYCNRLALHFKEDAIVPHSQPIRPIVFLQPFDVAVQTCLQPANLLHDARRNFR